MTPLYGVVLAAFFSLAWASGAAKAQTSATFKDKTVVSTSRADGIPALNHLVLRTSAGDIERLVGMLADTPHEALKHTTNMMRKQGLRIQ